MIKRIIGVGLFAMASCSSAAAFAQCNDDRDQALVLSSDGNLSAFMTSAPNVPADNFGLYNWDEATQTWVLLHAGYDPAYEDAQVAPGEYVFEQSELPAPGPGGGVMNLQLPSALTSPETMNSLLLCGDDQPEDPSVPTMPKVVAHGIGPSGLGGAMLAVIYRIGSWFGLGSASVRTVTAPDLPSTELDQATCNMPVWQRQNAATSVAGKVGMQPHPAQMGRKLRIKWRTGTVETYQNFGMSGGSNWMKIVPGTCQDAN